MNVEEEKYMRKPTKIRQSVHTKAKNFVYLQSQDNDKTQQQTINIQPSTINIQPSTINIQPSTLNNKQ